MSTHTVNHELPQWLWLWLVVFLLAIQFAARFVSPEFSAMYMEGEYGLMENLTVVILAIALFIGISILKNHKVLRSSYLTAWYGLLVLGCLYFAGEEASWGQHWLGWETPDDFRKLNDQEETNLHNMSSWLDQKPRTLIEIAAIIGGIIMPVYWRIKDGFPKAGTWQAYFWPTWVCVPVSIIIGTIKLPDRLIGSENIPNPFDLNVSEAQEVFVAMAFLIYFSSVAVRMKRQKRDLM
ncbi:hypothetical protein [Sneathiella aquimaris]|uniref:hypothetical protein n=1 Tax=Sneathiella aquimaris TaxID=2599305 RepID=UPI00146B33F9|nr:hypothetical protein [Sneathiella aquimaris]